MKKNHIFKCEQLGHRSRKSQRMAPVQLMLYVKKKEFSVKFKKKWLDLKMDANNDNVCLLAGAITTTGGGQKNRHG